MNVVFLSPHFPPQFFLFAQALRAQGHTVLGIGDTPFETLRPELQRAVSAWYQVGNLENYEQVMRAVAHFIHAFGRIDRIDSLNEHWLDTEARLREDFNVPGPRPAEMRLHRSKTGMRSVFRKAGVPCSTGELVEDEAQVRRFVKEHGFPVVFKPDTGVGAQRTFKVSNEKELGEALEEKLEGYVVEKFEKGRLTSFDGIADREGRIVYVTSHLFSAGIMDIVNERRTMYYLSRREIPAELQELGEKSIAAFGIRERFFHFEFFEDDEGHFKALEVNIRPPGGFTTDLMNYAADVDVYALWARVLSGEDLSKFEYKRRYHVAHIGRRAGTHYEVDHAEAVRRLGSRFILHRPMPQVLAGAMGDEMYLVRDPDEEKLFDAIRLLSS